MWCIHSSHPHSRNVAFNYSIVSEGMFGKIHALGADWRNDAVVTHVCRGQRWMLGGRRGWSGRPQVTHEWSRAPRLTSGAPAWGAIRLPCRAGDLWCRTIHFYPLPFTFALEVFSTNNCITIDLSYLLCRLCCKEICTARVPVRWMKVGCAGIDWSTPISTGCF